MESPSTCAKNVQVVAFSFSRRNGINRHGGQNTVYEKNVFSRYPSYPSSETQFWEVSFDFLGYFPKRQAHSPQKKDFQV